MNAPVSPVTSQPLAPITSTPLAAPKQTYAVPARPSPHATLAPVSAPATTASISRPVSGWSAEGGTPIVVAQGESVAMLSTRYGVPADALLRSNGFSSAAQVQPGARLVIPVYNGRATANFSEAPAASMRQAAAPAQQKVLPTRAVAAAPAKAGEKLNFVQGAKPSAEKGKATAQVAAKAAPVQAKATAPVKVAEAKQEKLGKPVADTAMAKPAKQTVAKVTAPPVDRETTTASVTPDATSAAPSVSDSDKPEFRWPARGRIIQGFKSGGNDGINIAVPEGTSVKAAEAGVVAYAGSELKGYGNLVLIRHPNGFVSAYANNGEINVKRGDNVKRGQAIAKSGQTGNVSSPQLHFELRKGSTPVDPTNYLAGL